MRPQAAPPQRRSPPRLGQAAGRPCPPRRTRPPGGGARCGSAAVWVPVVMMQPGVKGVGAPACEAGRRKATTSSGFGRMSAGTSPRSTRRRAAVMTEAPRRLVVRRDVLERADDERTARVHVRDHGRGPMLGLSIVARVGDLDGEAEARRGGATLLRAHPAPRSPRGARSRSPPPPRLEKRPGSKTRVGGHDHAFQQRSNDPSARSIPTAFCRPASSAASFSRRWDAERPASRGPGGRSRGDVRRARAKEVGDQAVALEGSGEAFSVCHCLMPSCRQVLT